MLIQILGQLVELSNIVLKNLQSLIMLSLYKLYHFFID